MSVKLLAWNHGDGMEIYSDKHQGTKSQPE